MTSYSGIVPQWLENNKKYVAETFPSQPKPFHMVDRRREARDQGKLSLVLTCMDPRCVPESYFGPNISGPVFRNAGGRATEDAIRSIATLRALADLNTIAVVHHTDCGVLHLESKEVVDMAAKHGSKAKAQAEKIDFQFFTDAEFDEAIREDVKALKNAPILAGMNVYGFKLDTFTGKIEPVQS